MAPPTHVNTSTNNNATAATDHSVTMPTFIQDDVVVAVLAATASVDPMGTYSEPSGWTEIGTAGGVNITSVSAVRLQCFYRVMQSGDPGSQSFTQSTSSGFKAVATSYRGCDTTTPLDIAANSTGGANTSGVCPDVTTTNADTMVVRVVSSDDNETFTNASEDVRNNTGGIDAPGNGTNSALGDSTQASIGPTGTSAWTIGASEEWGTFTFALNPVLAAFNLVGFTKDREGNALGTSECFLLKYNQDFTYSFVDYTQSDVDGYYQFSGIADNDGYYQVIAWKDSDHNVFDTTDYVLTPVP